MLEKTAAWYYISINQPKPEPKLTMATINVIMSKLTDKGSSDLTRPSTTPPGSTSGASANPGLSDLAAQLRALQLFAHNAHNLADGVGFFGDHEFLGEAYAEYEEAYDQVVELMIGERAVGSPDLDLVKLQSDAVALLSQMPPEDEFQTLLNGELQVQSAVDAICKTETSQGIQNLVGAIAQSGKKRIYKLRRRLSNDDE